MRLDENVHPSDFTKAANTSPVCVRLIFGVSVADKTAIERWFWEPFESLNVKLSTFTKQVSWNLVI